MRWGLHLLLCGAYLCHAQEWGYGEEDGSDTWPDIWPLCGDSVRQSPIDVTLNTSIFNSSLTSFVFRGYAETVNRIFSVSNTGHNIQVDVRGSETLDLSGGGLPHNYRLYQFHLHWGSNDAQGSEHTVNGQHFPMEMHLVHWDTDDFNCPAEAEAAIDGLAVLGLFIELGTHNTFFQNIVDVLDEVSYPDMPPVIIPTFPLESFLPDTSRYHRYVGSLTTPPCYESKVWSIFNRTVEISQEQLNAFRDRLYSHESEVDNNTYLQDNFRPSQPIANRTLARSFDLNEVESRAAQTGLRCSTSSLAIIIAVITYRALY